MEKHIQNLFNPTLLQAALQAYGIAPQDADMLDGFENFMVAVRRQDGAYILRIGHDARRSPDMVHGEAEFLNHLHAGGLSVPQVLPSRNGNLTESIPAGDGSHFVTTLFTKAQGHPPTGQDWTPNLYLQMGRFMGSLHRLSCQFTPSQPRYKRFSIAEDLASMQDVGTRCLPPGDEGILQAYQETAQAILRLPRDPSSYGLCHIDFHGGNFFLDAQGNITLFDFDDCQYAWFVYDIAMALFYAISHDCTTPEALAKAHQVLQSFWQGYQQEYQLDPSWLLQIPKFLRQREIDLYIAIHRSLDVNNLDAWTSSFMQGRREKILQGKPYCALDYNVIAGLA